MIRLLCGSTCHAGDYGSKPGAGGELATQGCRGLPLGKVVGAVTWHTHKGYEVQKRHLLRRLLRRRAGGRLDQCALCRRFPSLRRRRQRHLERCLPAGGRTQLLSRNMTLFMNFDLA